MSAEQSVTSEVESLRERVSQLEALLAWYQKKLFGSGKSERQDALQTELALKELQAAQQQLERQQQEQAKEKPRERPRERPLAAERFAHLPVEETVEVVPEEVQSDPELYERIGEESTFEVVIEAPKVYKRQIVRGRYRHKLDRARPPVVAPAPLRPIEGSYASAELLTWILLGKYREHLPLYRQEKMLARWGAPVPRQSMSDWMGAASFWLQQIYQHIRAGLLRQKYLQLDETPIKFIDPDNKKRKTSEGYFWLMGSPGGNVYLHWSRSRGSDVARELLKGFSGVMQTDGYPGYNPVHSDDKNITRVACWAHARRKFAEALSTEPRRAGFVLRLIGQLYHLDHQYEARAIRGDARAAWRTSGFASTLALLRRTCEHLRTKALPQSPLGKACRYLLGQWDALVLICDHGHVQLDNNLIENAVRPTAVGKKNWLFVGHPDAGERSAIIYTILLCCERHGIDAQAYIIDILRRMPAMSNKDDFTPLLPQNWRAAETVSK